MKFSGSVDDGPRNIGLHFGDVPASASNDYLPEVCAVSEYVSHVLNVSLDSFYFSKMFIVLVLLLFTANFIPLKKTSFSASKHLQ